MHAKKVGSCVCKMGSYENDLENIIEKHPLYYCLGIEKD